MGRWLTSGEEEDAVIAKWGLTEEGYEEILHALPYSDIPEPSDVDKVLAIALKHLTLEVAVAFARHQLHILEEGEEL